MLDRVVITAVGEDRPGLVAALSGYVTSSGCNIEDSRMALLGSEFAMHLLVSGEPEAIRRLQEGLEDAGHAVGLTTFARKTKLAPPSGTVPYTLTAYAMDHPGIVQRLTAVLAEREVNIRGLETRLTHAPHTGQPLFSLHATIEVRPGEKIAGLRQALQALGESLNVDVEVKPAG